MVTIGSVWDSTTAVLAGRTGSLAGTAALAFLPPSAVQAAAEAFGGKSPGAAALTALVTLVALIASMWGQLAIVGIASDPATTRAQAYAGATSRLPAALLLMLVLLAAMVVLVLPVIGVLAASGFDFEAALAQAGSATQPKLPVGAGLFLFFYGLLIFTGALWLYARMFPLMPVVLHERRGIGAIGRAWTLTRGMTWRLIGFAILLVIVLMVASLAAQAVIFVVFRLALGAEQLATATFIGTLAAAVITAIFSTVVAVFAARLYVALRARENEPAASAP
jgi:hypothetical protein